MASTLLLLPVADMGMGMASGIAFLASPAHAGANDAAEKEAFEAAKELGTAEAWQAFLATYATGFRADLARAYLKKAGGAPAAGTAPPAPAPVAGEPAYELPCSDARTVRSERSTDPVKLRFVNQSEGRIIIQWIDFNGALKEYGQLEPGAEMIQDTFISHPWIAAYEEGSCRQMFLPGNGTTVAILRPESQITKNAIGGSAHRSQKASRRDEEQDHGATPEQTCRNIGQDYDGLSCVPRKKSSKVSKKTIERRAKAACLEMGMIYLKGQCAPRTKAARNRADRKKNKPCPAGMYRNPYGQCQPNETGG